MSIKQIIKKEEVVIGSMKAKHISIIIRSALLVTIFAVLLSLNSGCSGLISSDSDAEKEQAEKEQIEEEEEKEQITRPMTMINPAEMAHVKQRIANGVEPQATAYANLITKADSALEFTADPPDNMEIMGGYEPNTNLHEMRDWLWRNCSAAYSTALAYGYSGNTIYADKAVEILNDWANKGTTFTGNDRGLQLGSYFNPMLYAADLIWEYDGWKESDRNKFESWWREDILPHTRDVMIRKDNNWKDAGLLGVITAGAVFKDQEILDEAIWEAESYFERRYDPSVHIKGYWKIRKSGEHEDVVFLTREVTRADGRKGLSYTAYALTTMSQAFEIARYHGVNLWHRKTGQGVGMEELIETQFRWIILNEEFPWYNSPDRPGGRRNVFEIANNHYDNPSYESYLEDSRPIDGSQGDEYSTLNKGDIEPQSTDSSEHTTSIE